MDEDMKLPEETSRGKPPMEKEVKLNIRHEGM